MAFRRPFKIHTNDSNFRGPAAEQDLFRALAPAIDNQDPLARHQPAPISVFTRHSFRNMAVMVDRLFTHTEKILLDPGENQAFETLKKFISNEDLKKIQYLDISRAFGDEHYWSTNVALRYRSLDPTELDTMDKSKLHHYITNSYEIAKKDNGLRFGYLRRILAEAKKRKDRKKNPTKIEEMPVDFDPTFFPIELWKEIFNYLQFQQRSLMQST